MTIKYACAGWKGYLHILFKRLNAFLDMYGREIQKKKKEVPIQEVIINEGGAGSNPVTQVFKFWITRKQLLEEVDQILEVLEKDMEKNKDFFTFVPSFSHERVSEYESNRKLLLEFGEKTINSSVYEKLEEAKLFIKKWGKKEGVLGNEDSTGLLYIIYREIFVNKAKLQDKENDLTALTIARAVINDDLYYIKRWQDVFIEKKILRGKFCVGGLVDEFIPYSMTLQKYEYTLLEIFSIPNDIECYNLIQNMGNRIITLF